MKKEYKFTEDLYIHEFDMYIKKGTKVTGEKFVQNESPMFVDDKQVLVQLAGINWKYIDENILKEIKPFNFKEKIFNLNTLFLLDAVCIIILFLNHMILSALSLSVVLVFVYLLNSKKESDKKLKEVKPYNAFNSVQAEIKRKPNRLKKIWFKFRPRWRGFLLKVYNKFTEALILFLLLNLFNLIK